MDKLVSIVIPVYKVEDYLDRCVQSVVNQTYKNLEIILVNDGSPDNCPEMCDNWAQKDSRIRVVHKENEGQGLARSLGIDIARGEYITFFDSDDYVDSTIIEKSVRSAEKYSSDVVIYGRTNVLVDGSLKEVKINVPKEVFKGNSVSEELLPAMLTYTYGFGITSCRLYKLSVLRLYGVRFMSERKFVSEDTRFSLELFSKDITVSVVPQGLYYYCAHPQSFSRRYEEERQDKNDLFLKINSEFIRETALPDKVLTHLMVRYHFFTIAAMKQLLQSDLSKKEKRNKLSKFFNNHLLRTTLTNEALSLEKPALRLFFYTIKFRCYFLSRFLLKIKLAKEN